ncbi:MAG: cysteine rich repeat-containing protein [Nitrospira sp.]|nr:cysteine rich repeat-containing protein [Nitrospira sp.]
MRKTWRDQRVNRKIVLVGGFVTAMVGAHGFAWSAGDPHAPPTQDAPAASSVPSNADGAGAEDRGRGGRQGRKACAEDVKKLCAGIKPGEGRIVQCLKEHTQDLSPACADTMQQRGKRRS